MDVRWLVRVGEWRPEEAEWDAAMARVEAHEQARIKKFNRGRGVVGRLNPDAKASLVGRLMIAALVEVGRKGRAIQPDVDLAAHVRRTPERKPYIAAEKLLAPGLNFNVSHSGECVACAASAAGIIGCDVMKVELVPDTGRPLTHAAVTEFFELMLDSFTKNEWRFVNGEARDFLGSPYERLEKFYMLWTLKESYIKAIGVGLGIDLASVSFAPSGWGGDDQFTAALTLLPSKGKPATGDPAAWAFRGRRLPGGYIVATALGPFAEAAGGFKPALAPPQDPPSAARVQRAGLPYAAVPVEDLLCDEARLGLPVASV